MRARLRFSSPSWSRSVSMVAVLAVLPATRAFAQDTAEQVPPVAVLPPAPPGYYPPPPPTGIYRLFSLTIAAGPGALWGPGESDFAVSYNLFRAAVGVARNFALVAGFEGVGARAFNPAEHVDSWLKQEVWFGGVQYFVLPQLHVRLCAGLGAVSESTPHKTYSGGKGYAFSAGVGYELIQLTGIAVGVEAYGNTTRYPTESWEMAGFNLALSFF
jgi:hypothetical protein